MWATTLFSLSPLLAESILWIDLGRGLNGCLTGEAKITRGYKLPA